MLSVISFGSKSSQPLTFRVAHGANDRSNAIGPMAAVWQVLSRLRTGQLAAKAEIPLWLVLLGSAGIAVGVLIGGAGV